MRVPALFALAAALAAEATLALLAFGPTEARAEKADRDKPINWSGNRLTGRRTEGGIDVVELEGKVVVTQGTRTIEADRAVVRQNADGSMSATAFGNPVSYRERRDATGAGTGEYVEAFALRAEYDGQKKVLELFDRALLKRDSDEVRASYISYNTETESYRADGQRGGDGKGDPGLEGRVRGIFQPKNRDARDDKPRAGPALQPSTTLPRPKD